MRPCEHRHAGKAHALARECHIVRDAQFSIALRAAPSCLHPLLALCPGAHSSRSSVCHCTFIGAAACKHMPVFRVLRVHFIGFPHWKPRAK
ncbi:hypothetical protein BZM27_25605 [Paraburkholderia steynii]|uniref:Uncharacterized protein n=1 Tax=Paraburkholderia steynii TaxID=1245441 RepID=A0A4R0XBU9_9BURK|nr:hypothetical protein BZM27_25605 [Paraburkholderia steynii]